MAKYIIVEIDDEAFEIMRKNGIEVEELIHCVDCKHYDPIRYACETEGGHGGTWFPRSYCDRADGVAG